MNLQRVLCALFLASSLTGVAQADDQRIHVRGTVVSLTGATLAVLTASGPATIALAPGYRVTLVVPSDLSAIAPGAMVGTAAVTGPDGTLRAREVHIFLPDSKVPVSSGPWDTEPGSSMTNAPVTTIADAAVDGVGSHVLTLKLPDGDKRVIVPANAPIVSFAPGSPAVLVKGAHVVVLAVKHDDGTVTAASVNVGKDGLTPPM